MVILQSSIYKPPEVKSKSIITGGFDLAKSIFTVHGVDESGKATLAKPKVVSGKT